MKKVLLVFLLIAVAFPTIISIYNVVKATTTSKALMTNVAEEETEKNNSEKEEKENDKHWGLVLNIPPMILSSLEQNLFSQIFSDLLHPVEDLPTPPPKIA